LFNLWVCSPSTENKRKEINSPYARAIGIPRSSPVHPHLYIRKTKALWLTVLNFFLSSAPRHVSSSTSDLLTRHHKAGVQQQDSGARPGPEHKKLEYFLGTWKVETEIKANEYVPAGKGVTTATVTLGPGGFCVESRAEGQMPRTDAIIAYDSDAKVYTEFYASSAGLVGSGTGTVNGNTWTWMLEDKVFGKAAKGKTTITILSASQYTSKYEMLDANGRY